MDSEASRSSNATADSYIGSVISIVTKFEIRYEGILCKVNTEESSIGLTNVRSYGSEGRKKDGQQVPPSDKVYEYILFRGSDIKDLQVKSSPPPVQATIPIHHDPAIIQSQYSPPPSLSTSLPPSGGRPVAEASSYTSQMAVPRTTFQGGLPLYQPGESLGYWGSSPSLNADGSGLTMPIYWQGFYGPSNGLSHVPQQSLLQLPPGLSMTHSMPQPIYPGISAPTGSPNFPSSSVPAPNFPGSNMSAPNLPASNLQELAPPLLPPFHMNSANLTTSAPQPTLHHPHSFAAASYLSPSLECNLVSSALPSTTSPGANLVSVSQSTSSGLDINRNTVSGSMPKTAPILSLPYRTPPHSVTPNVGTFRSNHSETSTPPLVTPGQLLQPGPTTLSSSIPLYPAKKDVEVIQVVSSKPPPSAPMTTQAPILPLPSPANQKLNVPLIQTHHNRTNLGRGRGRGNENSRPVTGFTEEFDFMAMNEKFKKDEVWGDLGKANKTKNKEDGGDVSDYDDMGSLKVEKPVYVKEEFFDSISCESLGNGPRDGSRTKFSERRKVNNETFGDFPRHHGGRGGRWPGHGGRSRGSYYGRGNGYVGRGQGYY